MVDRWRDVSDSLRRAVWVMREEGRKGEEKRQGRGTARRARRQGHTRELPSIHPPPSPNPQAQQSCPQQHSRKAFRHSSTAPQGQSRSHLPPACTQAPAQLTPNTLSQYARRTVFFWAPLFKWCAAALFSAVQTRTPPVRLLILALPCLVPASRARHACTGVWSRLASRTSTVLQRTSPSHRTSVRRLAAAWRCENLPCSRLSPP